MSRRGRFWLIATVLVVVLAAAFYSQIEWVEQKIDAGVGEEASRNDFYAAELFLREHGVETETVTGMGLLDSLPTTDDLILLSASRESLSARRRDALISWVMEGGELLVVAHSLHDDETGTSEDSLLDALGIFLMSPTEDDSEEDPGDVSEEAEADSSSEAEEDELDLEDLPRTIAELLSRTTEPEACAEAPEDLTAISTGGKESLFLELASPNQLAVYAENLEAAYLSSESQMLALAVGEGRVIALTSIRPFLNRRIHCHDHAYFLWFAAGDREKVWLLHDPDVASLAELAWTKLPASMAGGLVLLLFAGAAASLRFGVANAEDEAPRRELREHLEASVTFQYRKGGFADLVSRLRKDLLRRGAVDLGLWADRSGVTRADADAALGDPVPWTRREIRRHVQTMLRMRRTK